MYGFNLVAIYDSFADAEKVSDRLKAEGLPLADIRLTRGSEAERLAEPNAAPREDQGFFAWLFGSDLPASDRDSYAANLRDGRAAVSVRVPDGRWQERAIAIMEEFNPVDIEEGGVSGASVANPATAAAAPPAPRATTAPQPGAQVRGGEREQVIPVVKEELAVGKRMSERRYRVKTYVIEKPVEQQVTLRDERVEIEHRPVSRAAGSADLPRQGQIDIVERHEEPVAEKRGKTVEEVVVRKEVTERPETVRGTVRETKVDVEKEPAHETDRRR